MKTKDPKKPPKETGWEETLELLREFRVVMEGRDREDARLEINQFLPKENRISPTTIHMYCSEPGGAKYPHFKGHLKVPTVQAIRKWMALQK